MSGFLSLAIFWGYSVTFSVLIKLWHRKRLSWNEWVVALVLLLIAWGLPYQEIVRVVIWCTGCGLVRLLVRSAISPLRLLRYSLIYFNSLMFLTMLWAFLSGDFYVVVGIGIPAVWAGCLGWRRLLQESGWGRGAV